MSDNLKSSPGVPPKPYAERRAAVIHTLGELHTQLGTLLSAVHALHTCTPSQALADAYSKIRDARWDLDDARKAVNPDAP